MATTKAQAVPRAVRILPILGWLPRYSLRDLPLDFLAGITIWALVVPEAMAYAGIAGVPVQYGLYAVPLALVGYALFGGSPQLVMGPSATIASLSAAGVGAVALAATSANAYIALTAILALLVGVLYMVGGLLKLGFIANFFAKPVLDGFIIGLGLFIVIGQLPKLVGIEKPTGNTVQIFWTTLTSYDTWNTTSVLVGVSSLVLLFGLKKWAPRVPGAIVVVVLSSLAVNYFDLTSRGVEVVGDVPAGFTFVPYAGISMSDVAELVPGAVAILIVGFAQSIAIAKSFGTQHQYTVDANKEMVAYGATNIGAGALQGFAVAGSLSKSAAAQEARLRSQVAPLITAVLVVVTILFFTGLFRDLPEPALAAIVIEAVSGMLVFSKLTTLRQARTPEFWAALGALLGVILINILPGVIIGCALSFALLIHSLDHPRVTVLGRTRDGARFRDVTSSDAVALPGVLILRFEAPVIYSNADVFSSEVLGRLSKTSPPASVVVLDLETVTQIDITGAEAFRTVHTALARRDVRLVLARAPGSVIDSLDRAGVLDELGGRTSVALTVSEAATRRAADSG